MKSILATLIIAFVFLPKPLNAQVKDKREVRAVWVATVENIDWPSSSGLPVDQQKHECTRMLDHFQSIGINTVYLQVRSAADALYRSSREPWSEWIMGKQGMPPNPYYDPLQFFIEESHRRGIELHAWINPYRAIFNNKNPSLSSSHVSFQHPDWIFKYGTRSLFDPGIAEVRNYIEEIILDLVNHYDIDGIHMDDYFYPYPIKGHSIPDFQTFKKFNRGFTNLEDWRRDNINLLIQEINLKIKASKPYVKFGISPFGIWKNKSQDSLGSETRGGSSFSAQYADSREWIKKEWVDYLIPQIYFSPESEKVPFKKLVQWWAANSFSRQIYIGIGAYRLGEEKENWNSPRQVPGQIMFCRSLPNIKGYSIYSAKVLMANNLGLSDSLRLHINRNKAIPPTMKWLDSIPPGKPTHLEIGIQTDGNYLHWAPPKSSEKQDSNLYYLIYRFPKGEPVDFHRGDRLISILYNSTTYLDKEEAKNAVYYVSACDRLWNEGEAEGPVSIKP